jgi:hypothetical protein
LGNQTAFLLSMIDTTASAVAIRIKMRALKGSVA